LAFPPLSWDTMHLQQDWFQLYLLHQEEISTILLLDPHKHLPHFPVGQLPPQLSAKARVKTKKTMSKSFEHEKSSCVHHIDPIDANAFLVVDQRENLLLAKEKIENELAYKFKSSDEKVITTLRKVFIEELENKITTSHDKTDKKIDQVSEQIETAVHAQEDMLSQIFMILKRMQESEEKWKLLILTVLILILYPNYAIILHNVLLLLGTFIEKCANNRFFMMLYNMIPKITVNRYNT